MTSGGSRVVIQLPKHFKVQGSSLATEQMVERFAVRMTTTVTMVLSALASLAETMTNIIASAGHSVQINDSIAV